MRKSKKQPRKQPQKRRHPTSGPPPETRASEAVTIAWMLAVMMTLLCELGVAGAAAYIAFDDEAAMIQMLFGTLLFAALVMGVISLLLTVAAIKSRRAPPPRGIVVLAIAVGAVPIVAALLRAF